MPFFGEFCDVVDAMFEGDPDAFVETVVFLYLCAPVGR